MKLDIGIGIMGLAGYSFGVALNVNGPVSKYPPDAYDHRFGLVAYSPGNPVDGLEVMVLDDGALGVGEGFKPLGNNTHPFEGEILPGTGYLFSTTPLKAVTVDYTYTLSLTDTRLHLVPRTWAIYNENKTRVGRYGFNNTTPTLKLNGQELAQACPVDGDLAHYYKLHWAANKFNCTGGYNMGLEVLPRGEPPSL